jgi:hypothetical protein
LKSESVSTRDRVFKAVELVPGAVVVDLLPSGLELSPDGLMAIYGYAAGYMCWHSRLMLDQPIPLSPRGIKFPVEPGDRRRVAWTLRNILGRPGMLQPPSEMDGGGQPVQQKPELVRS